MYDVRTTAPRGKWQRTGAEHGRPGAVEQRALGRGELQRVGGRAAQPVRRRGHREDAAAELAEANRVRRGRHPRRARCGRSSAGVRPCSKARTARSCNGEQIVERDHHDARRNRRGDLRLAGQPAVAVEHAARRRSVLPGRTTAAITRFGRPRDTRATAAGRRARRARNSCQASRSRAATTTEPPRPAAKRRRRPGFPASRRRARRRRRGPASGPAPPRRAAGGAARAAARARPRWPRRRRRRSAARAADRRGRRSRSGVRRIRLPNSSARRAGSSARKPSGSPNGSR